MLKQRVITAAFLLAVLLPALFYPTPVAFCFVALVLICAAGWEWARLNGCGQYAAVATALILATMCALGWYAGLLEERLSLVWTLTTSAWVVASIVLLRLGPAGWSRVPRSLRLIVGVLALWLAWLAVAQAKILGIYFLLSVLLLVWVADIFAYAAGRAFGGKFIFRKLAPSISPGKSWEGVCGAVAGVVILSTTWGLLERTGRVSFDGSLYARLWDQYGLLFMLIAVVFLAGMSVVGDLVESLVKRSAGVKDSSGLLPGHGGVLDRLDALLPAIPVAMMLVSV